MQHEELDRAACQLGSSDGDISRVEGWQAEALALSANYPITQWCKRCPCGSVSFDFRILNYGQH